MAQHSHVNEKLNNILTSGDGIFWVGSRKCWPNTTAVSYLNFFVA